MSIEFQLFFLFISTFCSSLILIRLLIKPLSYFGLVDVPGNRRAHKNITPRGAGLALLLALVINSIIFEYQATHSFIYSSKLLPIFIFITLVSFLDDIKNTPIFLRFLVHLICAGTAIFIFLVPNKLFHSLFPLPIDFFLATLCLTAFLNIYNFLDGVDGLTAVETIHLSLTILILCYIKYEIIINVNLIIIIAILTCAYSLSFLFFNWHPAKIFLGDVGSIGLGFLIGLSLLLICASSGRLFASAIIASLYYIADGGLTIIIRLINKEKIWQPHLKHFFQKAVRSGKSHRQVVGRIILCNSLLMIFSINALNFPVSSIIMALIVVIVTLINFAK